MGESLPILSVNSGEHATLHQSAPPQTSSTVIRNMPLLGVTGLKTPITPVLTSQSPRSKNKVQAGHWCCCMEDRILGLHLRDQTPSQWNQEMCWAVWMVYMYDQCIHKETHLLTQKNTALVVSQLQQPADTVTVKGVNLLNVLQRTVSASPNASASAHPGK